MTIVTTGRSKKYKFSRGIVFFPILFIILTISLLSFSLYKKYVNKPFSTFQPSSQFSSSPSPSPVLTPDSTKKTASPSPVSTSTSITPSPTNSGPQNSAANNTIYSTPFPTKTPFPTTTPLPSPTFNKAATVTLTSPNGGEQYQVGQTVRISWTTTGPLTNFMIGYSSGPGSLSWIDEAYYGTGYYDWRVNVGTGTDTQFKIYVSGVNLNGILVSDYSDNYFTVNR